VLGLVTGEELFFYMNEWNGTKDYKKEHTQLKGWVSFLGNKHSFTGTNGTERYAMVRNGTEQTISK